MEAPAKHGYCAVKQVSGQPFAPVELTSDQQTFRGSEPGEPPFALRQAAASPAVVASLRQQRFGALEERCDLAPPALGPLPPAPVAVVANLQDRF